MRRNAIFAAAIDVHGGGGQALASLSGPLGMAWDKCWPSELAAWMEEGMEASLPLAPANATAASSVGLRKRWSLFLRCD